MKVFLVTKTKIIWGLSVLAASLLAFIFTFTNSFLFADNKKKLPIYKVNRDEKIVSISFDAAWGNEYTQTLLDVLKKYDVKTTFFLVGMWVDKFPHLPKQNAEKIREQIENCNNKVEKLTGKRPILFRFPYGDYDNKSMEELNNLNMYPIQWNIDSLDWKNKKCEEMCKRIIPKLSPGSIILMHNGAKYTAESLPTIIERIQSEGYKIVPISEIIYKDNYSINTQGEQYLN